MLIAVQVRWPDPRRVTAFLAPDRFLRSLAKPNAPAEYVPLSMPSSTLIAATAYRPPQTEH